MSKIRSLREQKEEEIEIGDQVKHPKFGIGTVLYKSGTGERAKAIVVFPEEGQKKLLLKYAKLKRIKEAKSAEEKPEGISEEEIIAAIEDTGAHDARGGMKKTKRRAKREKGAKLETEKEAPVGEEAPEDEEELEDEGELEVGGEESEEEEGRGE